MMKRIGLVVWLGLTGALVAAQRPFQLTFKRGAAHTWDAEWQGTGHRTYFYQWSLDLVHWNYAPFVEFGAGPKSWGLDAVDGAGAPLREVFVRLKYHDDPQVETLAQAQNADFDQDGIPNLFEVATLGTDPLDGASNGGDFDSDGLADGFELYHFGDLTSQSGADDFDGDGLSNAQEFSLGTNPTLADTDGDGILDGVDSEPLTPDAQPVTTATLVVWTTLK